MKFFLELFDNFKYFLENEFYLIKIILEIKEITFIFFLKKTLF
jgi:hypothetical protein